MVQCFYGIDIIRTVMLEGRCFVMLHSLVMNVSSPQITFLVNWWFVRDSFCGLSGIHVVVCQQYSL